MEPEDTLSLQFQQYYAEATRWKHELEFYQQEVAFLHHILDRQLHLRLTDTESKQLGEVLTDLFDWATSVKSALRSFTQQTEALSACITNPSTTQPGFKGRQDELHKQIEDIRCKYIQLKTGLYELANQLLHDHPVTDQS